MVAFLWAGLRGIPVTGHGAQEGLSFHGPWRRLKLRDETMKLARVFSAVKATALDMFKLKFCGLWQRG